MRFSIVLDEERAIPASSLAEDPNNPRRDRDEIRNEFGNLNPARDGELNEVVESVPDEMEVR
jgi:hypothetical protein